ncbi:PASTA domain-containing protein [Thermus sp. PS18]|uniref:PASTA domain-containing protein n=1 Tax=Thermus sp. PS18 TaxID=2849039 RepID=UPI0022648028|nr:PASTA domain-containing protein [Thermus sp. PS18]UZX15734.1 PASTA domain-containing protein [Thermus sp. PS18]
MILDDRYPVLETLEEKEGITLYRVEGGVVFFFQVRTPEDKERFYRYRAAIKRLEELGLVEAVVSAKPGRYYAFFPERPLARKAPPRPALEALAPLGFGPEHLAMAEEGVAYLSPWPLGSARRAWARAPSRLQPGFLLGVAPGLLLFLLGLWLFSQGVYRYFNPPEYAVPNLVGKTAREAFLLLKDTGLRLEVVEGNDPAKPKEVVLAQEPPPGTRLRAGRTVRLTLNQARLNPLPELKGLRQEEAEARLSELGYRLAGVAQVESPEPLGTVLASDPPPGTPLPPGASVRLLVSRGASLGPTVPLPQLTGLSQKEALFLLNAMGLQVQVEEVPSGAPPGTVLAQEPAPGTPMPPGSGVRLRVAARGEVLVGALSPLPAPKPQARTVTLALNLPREAEGRQVRLVLVDDRGEHLVYEGEGRGGLRVSGTYEVVGEARFRLYLDGELFQEWAP